MIKRAAEAAKTIDWGREVPRILLGVGISYVVWASQQQSVKVDTLVADMATVKQQVSSLKEQVTLTYSAIAAAGDNALRNQRDAEQDRRLDALEGAGRRFGGISPQPTGGIVPVTEGQPWQAQ